MEPELDPQVQHAVDHPAETARGPEEVQLRVRVAGEPARRALGAHWENAPEDAAPDDDRLAAAVLLATLFDDRFWLERAARPAGDVPGCPSAPPAGLLGFTRVPGARAALAPVLERPLLTGLLEWGTNPLPEQPPVAVARAVRDLAIPDDARVYRVVRRRAERFLAREHDGSAELERFVGLLTEAERGRHEEDGPVLSGETLPPVPPAASDPAPPAGPGTPWSGPSTSPTPAEDGPGTPGRGEDPGRFPGPAPGPFSGEAAGPGAPGQPPVEPGAGGRGPVFGPGAGGWPPHPAPPEEEDDSDNLKAWGIVFLVILGVIAALVLVL